MMKCGLRRIPGWWFMVVLCVIFWAGHCVGTASGCRTDEWVLNPVRYWFLLQQLRQSPWGWTSPELQQALRDAQAELGVLCAGGTAIASAYWYGGPQLALMALSHVSGYSMTLRKLSVAQGRKHQGVANKTRSSPQGQTIVVDLGKISSENRNNRHLAIETQPQIVD